MTILVTILLTILNIVPKGEAFINPQIGRDSIYVGDRLVYGFELDNVRTGTEFALPDVRHMSNDTIRVIRGWKLDTLKMRRRKGLYNLRGSFIIAPFEEGDYSFGNIYISRRHESEIDTLEFAGQVFKVSPFPIDSTRVAKNELQPLVRYPITFREVFPWALGVIVLIILGFVSWYLILIRRRRDEIEVNREPAHVRALRNLDKYKGPQYWAPNKQKEFYSGVTDTIKIYIKQRYAIDAPEMITADLLSALDNVESLSAELRGLVKELFETADLVKFAKYIVADDYNSRVLSNAVRFVMETYQNQLEEEQKDVL